MRILAYWQFRDGTRRVVWDDGEISGDPAMIDMMRKRSERARYLTLGEDPPGDHLARALGFAEVAYALHASPVVGADNLYEKKPGLIY